MLLKASDAEIFLVFHGFTFRLRMVLSWVSCSALCK